MRQFIRLFHCESEGGNRAYEDQFQYYFVSRTTENDVQVMKHHQLDEIIAPLKSPQPDHMVFLSWAQILIASLERVAYDLWIGDPRSVLGFVFYDESIPKADGVNVD